MRAVTTKCRQQLLAAFVCHEVYACSEGIAHYHALAQVSKSISDVFGSFYTQM